jgi:hypothetical protein
MPSLFLSFDRNLSLFALLFLKVSHALANPYSIPVGICSRIVAISIGFIVRFDCANVASAAYLDSLPKVIRVSISSREFYFKKTTRDSLDTLVSTELFSVCFELSLLFPSKIGTGGRDD